MWQTISLMSRSTLSGGNGHRKRAPWDGSRLADLRYASWLLFAVPLATLVLMNACCLANEAATPTVSKLAWLKVAVVDFNELGGYTGRCLGLRCAEATQRLLETAGRWTMVPREDAVAAQRQAGVRPPFEASQLQRLADALRAELIVSGVIARVNLDHRRGSVALRVRVEVTEGRSGELVMAANGEGVAQADRTNPRPTDDLVEEALQIACTGAVRSLLATPPLEGRILARTGTDEYRTDLGKKSGLAKGQRVLIVRQEGQENSIVAVGLVRDVRDDHSVILDLSRSEAPRLRDAVVAP